MGQLSVTSPGALSGYPDQKSGNEGRSRLLRLIYIKNNKLCASEGMAGVAVRTTPHCHRLLAGARDTQMLQVAYSGGLVIRPVSVRFLQLF